MAIERHGLMYRETEGHDRRWHCDIEGVRKLQNEIPNYWEDTCPECGNKEGISGCRCAINHRTCPKCGTGWHWEVSKWKGILQLVR